MEHFNESARYLQDIIDHEVMTHLDGDYRRMIIIGNSQGGYLAYHLALLSPHAYGLVIPIGSLVIP